MAVEWVGVGLAVAKILLRAADHENIADAVDDARGGWADLRGLHRGDESAIGVRIANELEKHLGNAAGLGEVDFRSAAQAVADLFNRLAKDDDAVITARLHPDEFLDYASKHGGERERRLVPEHVESTFDRILEVASAEFARRAPGSARFSDAALAETLRELRTLANDARRAADERRSAPYAKAWAALDRLARRLRDGVRSDLGAGEVRLELDRTEERNRLVEAMTNAGDQRSALVVTGEPDVGKTALTLRAAEYLASRDMTVRSLSLRDLPPTILEMEQFLAMSVPTLLAANEAPLQLLVVDGAEAVLEGRRDVFHEVVVAALRAGVGVVAVTRTDGSNRVREVLQRASLLTGKAEPPIVYTVTRLAQADRQMLAETFKSLIRLAADSRTEWLLGRPGLVDVLLRAGTVFDSTEMLSEADVFVAVWNGLIRNHEERAAGGTSPDDREQAVLAVARRALGKGEGLVPGGGVWMGLRSDGVLRAPAIPALGSGEEFATDLMRDFALCRLFFISGWEALRTASAPRWTIRAVRLACEAKLLGGDRAATWRSLRAEFNQLSEAQGQRWAEVPVEALLSLGDAEAVIEQIWDELVADGQAELTTLLRLARLRYVTDTFGDPFALAPVVSVTFCNDRDFGRHDRYSRGGVGETIRELVLAWLRGMVRDGRGPDSLRQHVRDRILTSAPESYDEFAVEALAMLGADINEPTERWLRGIESDDPYRLQPAIESVAVALSMSEHQPELLLDLTEAYYIEHPDPDRDRWGRASLFEDGIRDHEHGLGPGASSAAWYYGPFFRLLKARPVETLAMINRMLDHAARTRVQPPQHRWTEFADESGDVDGIDVDIPGIGPRHYVGDGHVWAWYRGSTAGPYPCMSALLAVERFADQLISAPNIPPGMVVQLLLRECHNLAMPGLVVGLLVRHLDKAGDLLDGWLAHPLVWSLEFTRVTHEGSLHVQGPDADDLVGRDHRRLSPRDVAARMTLRAIEANDQVRLDELAAVADRLLANARAEVESHPDPERLIVVEGWASIFRPENYHLLASPDGSFLRSEDGSLLVQHEPPEPVTTALAPSTTEYNIGNEAIRLQMTYGVRDDVSRGGNPEALMADISLARRLAADPPVHGVLNPEDPIAAVAAAAIIGQARGRIRVQDDDLRWAAETVLTAAGNPYIDAMSYESTVYPMAADRAAAKSVPFLLLEVFDHLTIDQSRIQAALTALGGSLFDEVRAAFVTGCATIWTVPCAAGTGSNTTCYRHDPLWQAVQAGLAGCRLGPWTQHAQRRTPQYLPPPYTETLGTVPANDLLVNRLAPPIASTMAARTARCIGTQATALLPVLLDTHRRGMDHWMVERYPYKDQQRELVARVLIELTVNGETESLIDHLQTFAANALALDRLLTDFATLFTYDSELRDTLPTVWPSVMQASLDALGPGGELLGDDHWVGDAIAALLPTPQIRVDDWNPDETLSTAGTNWLPPQALDGLLDRWITIATGKPEAANAIGRYARTTSAAWQSTTGLTCLERVMHNRYDQFANRCWFVTNWLSELRGTTKPAPDMLTCWRRIVDGLAAAGDRRAVDLQRIDE